MLVWRVLGPVEVAADDTRVDLGGLLPRRLLTALLAAGGQAVPDDQLVDAVWGLDPPAKTAAALQVYVSRLRGAVGREVLQRDRLGYRLAVDSGSVDTTWFAGGVAEGRRLLAAGRAEDAVKELTAALGLWRGEPYADLADSSFVDAVRRGWWSCARWAGRSWPRPGSAPGTRSGRWRISRGWCGRRRCGSGAGRC